MINHEDGFFVARDGARIVGVVGIQVYGTDALLRSLVVHPDFRGRGLARKLCRNIVLFAREQGVRHLYLLTTTIEPLCVKWGFRRIDRKDVPEAIKNTAEFKGLCPRTAVCFYQKLAEAVWAF